MTRTLTRDRDALTSRELEVLRMAATGMKNPDIGKQLWLTEQTIKFHISNVIRKLGVSTRGEAVWRALELGLIQPPLLRFDVESGGCPHCGEPYL